jgi:hypothetical protein
MPPFVNAAQTAPICPQPHSWIQEESETNAVITTSLLLAPAVAKNQMVKMAPAIIMTTPPHLASPGKAINGRGSTHQYKELLMDTPAKCQKPNPPLTVKSHGQFWPQNLLDIIKLIVNLTSACPEKPLFNFIFNNKAAEKNYLVLKRLDFDISRAIKAQSLLPLGYGSEFRKGNILSPLLKHHPLWPRMEQLLLEGTKWPMSPIPKECRVANLNEAIKFGNY